VEQLDEHPVPVGPLAVRWRALSLPPVEAGALVRGSVEIENAGSARWRDGVNLSYHWLDERGNPIFWDGLRTPLALAPGDREEVELRVRGPIPPGRYRLALDIVDEHRFWFAELGNHAPEREVEVRPRDAAGARAFLGDAEPAPEWRERVRAAHEEGYAAVGGAVDGGPFRRVPDELEAYAPGGGRNPAFAFPLVCPSLLPPLEPNAEVAGLPAYRPDRDPRAGEEEPWLYDARALVRLRSRSGRRRG
jgi:hypothetical protein